MSGPDRLYTEILRDPDSDEARVAYADAIGATDPARAELIRVQLQLIHSLRANGPLLDRSDAYNRERQLLDKHKDEWAKQVAGVPGVQAVNLMRGFPEYVRIAAQDFLDHGERLYALAPIRHLGLDNVKPYARELFQSPLLARIRTLSMRNQKLGDDEARLLASSPHVARLRWLDLAANAIGQPGLEAIAASANLRELRVLDFAGNAASDPTPQVAETDIDSGEVLHLDVTPEARALEARFGKRAWLSSPIFSPTYPPGREQF